jgi:hypothetical protein
MKQNELYIDEDGVKRGYYVYLHRSKETGKVLYVGKGSGQRAWNSKKRNPDWKSKVEELGDNWEVEIYEDDLTEIEAYRLEEKLVKELGFFDDENDQLTNRFPGGDMPATFTTGSDYEKRDWDKAYDKFRRFKTLDKLEKEKLATDLYEDLNEIYNQLWELYNEVDYSKDIEDETTGLYFPGDVIGAFEDAMVASKEFLKNRISWKDFCLDIEYSFDWFNEEWVGEDKENAKNLSGDVFEYFLESRRLVSEAYQKIDSGNKQEAIQLANQEATNIPLKISSQIPDQANVIQILSEKKPDELFGHICQVMTSEGFQVEQKDPNKLSLETRFIEFKDDIKLQIKVSVEVANNGSTAFLKGRIKDPKLSKLFAKPEISFESIWCKTKYPRVSFGKLAVLALQEIAHTKINYLCKKQKPAT